jgi:hypothetical protein
MAPIYTHIVIHFNSNGRIPAWSKDRTEYCGAEVKRYGWHTPPTEISYTFKKIATAAREGASI